MKGKKDSFGTNLSYKFLVLGDQMIGKTSVLERYVNNTFKSNYLTTIGMDKRFKRLEINNTDVDVFITDTAGEERFRSLTKMFYKGADGIFVGFSLVEPKTLESIDYWISQINENTSKDYPISLVLFGNKCDDKDHIQVKQEDIDAIKKKYDLTYFETSAKENINIQNLFEYLIKILEENNKELMDKYEMTSKENAELKNIYSEEINKLTIENNSKEEQIRIKNEKLKEELNQVINDYDIQIKTIKNKVAENENNIIPKMKQKILDLQNEKENLSQDIELCGKSQKHKLAEIALQYEDQKEQIINNNRQQLEDNNNENDQQIQEIRKLYQIEKDKISEQMRNENDLAQQRINQIEKEQNDILNDLEKEKDDKIAELQDNLDEINLNHEEYVKKVEKEIFLRNQKIENLQKFINDTKNSIDVIKMQQEQYLKEQNEEFENEKNILNEKIKNAEKDCETTELEITKLTEQNTQLENNLNELKKR